MSYANDWVVISNVIISSQDFRRISILPSGNGSAFFEGAYDDKPDIYAIRWMSFSPEFSMISRMENFQETQ